MNVELNSTSRMLPRANPLDFTQPAELKFIPAVEYFCLNAEK